MFKYPSERESAKGLVRQAQGQPLDIKIQILLPLFIGIVALAVSLGVLSLVLSMSLWELLFDRTKKLQLRIFVPIGSFLASTILSYFYFCVLLHYSHRKAMNLKALNTFRRTTYEIFQQAEHFRKLGIDHRMTILVTALEPLKEIIIPEEPWDRRAKVYTREFIQHSKLTIKALMNDLNLLDMHKETKLVLENAIHDKFTVDAKPPPVEIVKESKNEAMEAIKRKIMAEIAPDLMFPSLVENIK